ncbi:Cytoskeletal-regulatory complex EF hand [Popillia japonica]|uniref:Cytoskeletal-regulatory complex EF hand n=1 Tax=Popillia japonica TaxID=7064 RepID=A0AAW1LVE6_POPJA
MINIVQKICDNYAMLITNMDEDLKKNVSFKAKAKLSNHISEFTSDSRTRSLNAPSPIQQFGPCGRIMKNSAMVM